MNNIIKLFICLLLTCYFLFLINIYIFYKNECNILNNDKNEHFIGLLEIISNTVGGKYDNRPKTYIESNDNQELIKKETRHIYIKNNSNKSNNSKDYYLYNKKKYNYAKLNVNMNHNKIAILDKNDNKLGNLTKHHYNDYYIESEIFVNKEIIVNFINQYDDAKINIKDDDKYFYIKKIQNVNNDNIDLSDNDNSIDMYIIYVYGLKIGKIKNISDKMHHSNNSIFKIIVYEEYKEYLNIFAMVFTMLLNQ